MREGFEILDAFDVMTMPRDRDEVPWQSEDTTLRERVFVASALFFIRRKGRTAS